MVQFNLLPEVKIEFIKARRQKQMITVIALIAGAVSLGIFIISVFVVMIAQPQLIKMADNKINESNETLKAVPDINKILTVQNQLDQLTKLHEEKPAVSRIFQYLNQVTPKGAALNKLTVDMTNNTMTVGGTADSLNTVRIFTDTLKLTTYQSDGAASNAKAFPEVVLASFATTDRGATFSITMKFDKAIFESTQTNLLLNVPPSAGGSKENVFTEEQ